MFYNTSLYCISTKMYKQSMYSIAGFRNAITSNNRN